MRKLNVLCGQGLEHYKICHCDNLVPKMSSLDMVCYINAERKSKADAAGLHFPCKQFRVLQHKSFIAKVPKVMGDEQSAKYFAYYTDDKGRSQPCYKFPKREACLMAMSYSYDLQAKVYDYMDELDRKSNGYLNYSVSELQDIVSRAREVSNEHSSAAGRRLRKRQEDLMILEKAESMVKSLSQLKLDLILADKNEGGANV
ncbi:Rha family transcriptional regulator [Pantoea ananatis]|uniref:Rha family transcriptional regulator n=1 Tax=Pantoea ananas TaxID=553 RepID=UPI000B7F73A6|nr:Rha family transcriptional regulator [Pantoea ananatis]